MTRLKKILLAEDNLKDIELTISAFGEGDLVSEIEVARDGVEVMDYLNRENRFANRGAGNPDLILLDVKMPRMDGIEVLQAIKGHPQFKSIPVVALTSSNQEKDIRQAYDLGVNGYVVKPVIFDAFLEAVQAIGRFWLINNQLPAPRPPASR